MQSKEFSSRKAASLLVAAAATFSSMAMAEGIRAKDMFRKPLITGASVSADYGNKSPGKTLALRYTTPENITTKAYGGRPGREVIKEIKAATVNDRTIILAVDFLFWDSTLADPDPSRKALQQLVGYASDHKIPIILGEIPELLPGRQPMRAQLNTHIQKTCASYVQCYVMPFNQLHQQVLKDGFLEIKGKRYSLKELVPDGLHLSAQTSEYLADLMLAVLSKADYIDKGQIVLPKTANL